MCHSIWQVPWCRHISRGVPDNSSGLDMDTGLAWNRQRLFHYNHLLLYEHWRRTRLQLLLIAVPPTREDAVYAKAPAVRQCCERIGRRTMPTMCVAVGGEREHLGTCSALGAVARMLHVAQSSSPRPKSGYVVRCRHSGTSLAVKWWLLSAYRTHRPSCFITGLPSTTITLHSPTACPHPPSPPPRRRA